MHDYVNWVCCVCERVWWAGGFRCVVIVVMCVCWVSACVCAVSGFLICILYISRGMSVCKHHDTMCVCVCVCVCMCVCVCVCVCVCCVCVCLCMCACVHVCVALGTNAQIYCDLRSKLQCHDNFMRTHTLIQGISIY